MEALFIKLLNMSITASWLVLVIIVLRFLLKKAPKWIMGVLWAFVAVRLVCPFSFESMWSMVPSAETIPPNIITTESPVINSGLPLVNQAVNPVISQAMSPEVGASANPMQIVAFIASVLWVIGMLGMLIYTVVTYLLIYRKVREAAHFRDNIWLCDRVATPFIFGVFKPRIYLPSSMAEEDMKYVVPHEQAHLKRKDHIWKPLGFLLLTIYWFNPILWVAYVLLCKDIELACDEKVIRECGAEIKKPYSNALIRCSVPRRMIAACPLAFGEVGVKERVNGVLNYKKPAFWIIIAAVTACVITAVCMLTNPVGIKITQLDENGNFSRLFDEVNELTVRRGENSYTTQDDETIRKIVVSLQEIEIKSKPISQSLAEERDMTNRVTINGGDTLCFSEDCSELWIYTGVKPTYSHKVLNPSTAKRIFEAEPAKKTTAIFSVLEKGFDVDGVSVSVKWAELNIEKPYIELEWFNNSKEEMTFPETFAIQHYDEGGMLVSCASGELMFDAVANLLPPGESRVKTYDVARFDLSAGGKYRFQVEQSPGKYIWFDFEIASAETNTEAADSGANTITGNRDYFCERFNDSAFISLIPETKSFTFSISRLSSYFPKGTYEETEDSVILKTDDGEKIYTFRKHGDDLMFDANKSSEMPRYSYSRSSPSQVSIDDGAIFQRRPKKGHLSKAIYDIDGDGKQEICALDEGPDTYAYSVMFSVKEGGALEYLNTFYPEEYGIAFVQKDGKLKVQAGRELFDILLKDGNIVLANSWGTMWCMMPTDYDKADFQNQQTTEEQHQQTTEEEPLQKLAMTSEDVRPCYNLGVEMLSKYYEAEVYGTDVNLDSYFSAPMLKVYAKKKVATQRLIGDGYKSGRTMLSMEFPLIDSRVSGDYIYCRINARIEYREAGISAVNQMSGYGELAEMLFIKTVEGYKVADWYADFTYDEFTRGRAATIDDPDFWLKSDAANVLKKCDEHEERIIRNSKK